jgi:hypothetical protein
LKYQDGPFVCDTKNIHIAWLVGGLQSLQLSSGPGPGTDLANSLLAVLLQLML